MSPCAKVSYISPLPRSRDATGPAQDARQRVRAGAVLCGSMAHPNAVLMLRSGTIRIGYHADPGHALYRLYGCDGCILSATLLGLNTQEMAVITAETDLSLMSIPQHGFDDMMATSARFRSAVFQANAKQVLHLLQAKAAVVFV